MGVNIFNSSSKWSQVGFERGPPAARTQPLRIPAPQWELILSIHGVELRDYFSE